MTKELQFHIDKCIDLLESIGETCPVYVGFEKESYTLTRQEIIALAKCIYLIDTELNQNKND